MFFLSMFLMFFYKSEKRHVFYVFFICKLMFLTSMAGGAWPLRSASPGHGCQAVRRRDPG